MTVVKLEKILANNEKHITKITLDTGAVGWIASDVSLSALEGLLRKLIRKQQRLEKRSSR